MKHFIICLMAAMFVASCGQRSKIDYENRIDTTAVIDDRITDTTKILVSELPVKFDSTNVLLFAISLVDLKARGGYSKGVLDSYSSTDFASSYFKSDHLSGNFINLVFQDKDGKEKKLTDTKLFIHNVTFLRQLYKSTKTGYLLYTVYDRDTNADKKLDYSDLEALYISKVDGTDFKKLTKELHEFYDYNLIADENKLYLRTLEDVNKDGELNNRDKFHYYRIEFGRDQYSIHEFNPVKVFE